MNSWKKAHTFSEAVLQNIDTGHERNYESGAVAVNLGVEYSYEVGDYNSISECTLRETIAALTVMQVPASLKW